MSLNISHNPSIKKFLLRKAGASLHRQMIVLAGEEEWQKRFLHKEISDFEDDALWVGDKSPEKIPFVETKKYRSWLGNEKRIVIFDANSDFDPDSFAAVSGIVVGGGIFFLLLPHEEKWSQVYSSLFGKRLIKSLNKFLELIVIKENNEEYKLNFNEEKLNVSKKYTFPFLTAEQQMVVEKIENSIVEDKNVPLVLISDRGRGKSAALGITAARLVLSGIKNILITAPSFRVTNVFFKHVSELLPHAEISRGSVKYGESLIRFYSPDQLIHDDIKAGVLVVDESAAIPVPLLTKFLRQYPQCVFATTVHGYEGTGRGFSLRFFNELDKHNSNWVKLVMKTPVRWAINDPLEKWMFKLLCLDADIVDKENISEVDAESIKIRLLIKDELIDDLLNDVFALLVIAHYRTRPKDLKSLLDDENISVYISTYKNHVVAVALVIREGNFGDSLSEEVYRGKRRPQGHLLAQSLTYHCGVKKAATLDYARVMRIAVHPELQGKGIGTQLLKLIINKEKNNGRDAIGTSFGMNERLLSFWYSSKFNMARIGFTREQTSGEHAAVMLLALGSKGEKVAEEVFSRFKSQIPFLLNDVLSDLPKNIKASLDFENDNIEELSQFDEDDLQSFIDLSRNYELCIASINKLFQIKSDYIYANNFPDDFRAILVKKIVDKESWNELVLSMSFKGKSEARKAFYNAVVYLVKEK